MRFRWNKKELDKVSDLEFLRVLCVERKSDCTNVYSPLYKKINEIEKRLETQIALEAAEAEKEHVELKMLEIDKTIIGRDSDEVMKEKGIKDVSDLCDYVDSCGGTICSGIGGCSRCMRIEDFPEIPIDGNHFVCNECIEKEKEKNKHIEILQHDISYWFDDDSELEEGVGEAEHIEYMIGQGYFEGELRQDATRGYWKIVKG